jgi:predicted dehydrogenase
MLFAAWRGVPVYDDCAAMLDAQRPRILCVATHPDSHLRYCELAAKKGVPVVICEKPLADSRGAARKIAALAKKIRVITNHERRYSADYGRAREILQKKELGEMLSVNATLYMGKTSRLIDVLWHDGTHLADAMMFLTGSVMKHHKRCGAPLSSRTGTAYLFGSLGELPFCIEAGSGRDHLVFEIEVSCSEGRLRIGNGVFELWRSAPSNYAEGFRSLAIACPSFEGPTGYFANMLADAVCCVRDRERLPVSGAAEGLAVIEYLHQIGG